MLVCRHPKQIHEHVRSFYLFEQDAYTLMSMYKRRTPQWFRGRRLGAAAPVWARTSGSKLSVAKAAGREGNTRLFYKVFAYMLLGRMEDTLEIHQPEAQHGFRPNRRLEEHLVTANLFLDKAWTVGMTVWVVSSKVFDHVHWPALWTTSEQQGDSQHLTWTLQNLCRQQFGEVKGEAGRSRKFPITAGLRQGCVLSPRLFNAVLQEAMCQKFPPLYMTSHFVAHSGPSSAGK